VEINFNEFRKKIIREYNNIVKKLNNSICEDTDMDRVIIPVEDLRRNIDNFRNYLIILGCLQEEGKSDCQCILSDTFKVDLFDAEVI